MIDPNTIQRVEELIERMSIDYDTLKDQPLNTDAVSWYRERFLLFVGDSCPAAITAYMQKANSDPELSDLTKIHIMRDATRALEGKEF